MDKLSYLQMLNDLKSYLLNKGFKVSGCSQSQLEQLQVKWGKLPEYYLIWLSYFGIEAGDYLIGTALTYEELNDINEEAILLMEENQLAVPENMFTFIMHQGYTTLFFVERHCADPKVYGYTETEQVRNVAESFSGYVQSEIAQYMHYRV